jgi:gliding motility-associated-like protein
VQLFSIDIRLCIKLFQMLKVRFSFVFVILLAVYGNSQIVINNAYTPVQLVTDFLVGNGVSISNIVYTGNAGQIGYFNGSSSTIGLATGVVLSTGNVSDILPSGIPSTNLGGNGDNDLLLTAQSVTSNPDAGLINTTRDAAILEFDFVPVGDSVSFNFVFASEEYLDYVNTQWNDVFGFYLTGPNPAGGIYNGQNFALVPGTDEPITISTIQPDLNSEFYIDNPNNISHSFNGFTVPLAIKFATVCGQPYHFKFAIADCQDGSFDSGVFLEGGSFSSSVVDISIASISSDTAIYVYEGCTAADLIFSRPSWQTGSTLSVDIEITGTATMGTDFTVNTQVFFQVGEDTVIVQLIPTDDNLTEGAELITITASSINNCGVLTSSTGQLWILDEPTLSILEQDTLLQCKEDSILVAAIPSGGIGTVTLNWSNGSTGNSIYVSGAFSGDTNYIVTMTDECNNTFKDTLTVTVLQTLAIDTVIAQPSTCEPTGSVLGLASGAVGVPLYTWNGPGSDNPNQIDATVWQNLSSGWYYFTVTDNFCTEKDSIFVDILNPPIAKLNANPEVGCIPLQVTLTNSSQNADVFHWNFGNGQQLDVSSLSNEIQTYNLSATVQLIAYQGTLCADTAYASIMVGNCGCTDPNALNYNPLATIDNGSCQYQKPNVANIFTPNGDGSNDLFSLNLVNAEKVQLVILNRWGNVMFEDEGINPAWNGKTATGIPVSSGVYFYKFSASLKNGENLEGNGFIDLIR